MPPGIWLLVFLRRLTTKLAIGPANLDDDDEDEDLDDDEDEDEDGNYIDDYYSQGSYHQTGFRSS